MDQEFLYCQHLTMHQHISEQKLVECMRIMKDVCGMRVQKQSKEAKQAADAQDFSGFVTVMELAERMANERHVLEENAKRLRDLERTLYAPAAPEIASKQVCPESGTDMNRISKHGDEFVPNRRKFGESITVRQS